MSFQFFNFQQDRLSSLDFDLQNSLVENESKRSTSIQVNDMSKLASEYYGRKFGGDLVKTYVHI
ncbi:MAG: hypothetical protein ACE5KO_07085, partial [Candidatus Bathyarchaeia archaeon]